MGGILTKEAIECAQRLKFLEFYNVSALSGASLDVRVSKLYRQRKDVVPDENVKFDDLFFEVSLVDDKWVLESDGFYVVESVEGVSKGLGLSANLTARSSWARCGLQCFLIDDGLGSLGDYSGGVFFSVRTANTCVVLRPGDAPAQLRFAKDYFVPELDVTKVPDYKNIVPNAEVRGNGFTLTLDKKIKLYKGGLIDPKDDVSKHFEVVDISDGLEVGPRQFYIASSRERVRIPKEFMGYLHLTDHTGQEPFNVRPVGVTTHFLHGNAPFIDPFPRFEGTVTFENLPVVPTVIRDGMRLTELQLIRFLIPYQPDGASSRYKGQEGAQIALKSRQLRLFDEPQAL